MEGTVTDQGRVRRARRRRRVVIALVALGVVGEVVTVLATRRNTTEPPQFTTALVETTVYEQQVEVSGNIEVFRESDLAFAASGRIAAVLVAEGDYVTTGTRLIELVNDSQVYELAYTELELEEARLTGSAREEELLELDRAIKQTDLEDTRLRAPFDGVVSTIDVEVGDYVGAGDAVARVVDTSRLLAVLEVDEIDTPLLKSGQRVTFTFDALDDFVAFGTVVSIPVEAYITDQGLAMFDVEAVIDAPAPVILPGYSFVAEIVITEPEEILTIPSEALIEREGATFVLTESEGDFPQPVAVEVSELDSGDYRVLSGIEAGSEILVPPSEVSSGADAEVSGRGILSRFLPGIGGVGGGGPGGPGGGGPPVGGGSGPPSGGAPPGGNPPGGSPGGGGR